MAAKIDAYFDCTSYYSYLAFRYLLNNRKALASQDVIVEFHPIFLGGINDGSGNKPPWTLPAKQKYGKYDMQRSMQYFGQTGLSSPPFFPILSILPQRCMIYIKDHYPSEKFEASFLELWVCLWKNHMDISKPDQMAEALARHFSPDEVKQILTAANTLEYKQKLKDKTNFLVEQGAFGAPWYFVRNAEGKVEPFFGSDRFHFMWQFLGLDWSDISLRDRSKL